MGRFNLNFTPNTLKQKTKKTHHSTHHHDLGNRFRSLRRRQIRLHRLRRVQSCLAKMGHGDAAKAEAAFKKADADGSGEIDAAEFAALAEAACELAFKKIDADNSGNVSPAEITAAVKGVDASAFLAVADKDGDGEISLAEFKAALASNAKFMPLVFLAQ